MPALLAALALATQSPFDQAMKDGHIYYDRQEWDQALAHYGQAAALDPRSPDPHAHLGSTYSRMKRYEEALAAYAKAETLGVDRKDMRLYLAKEMGITYGLMKRFQDSAAALEKGLALDPKNEVLLRNLGVTYVNLNRIEDAVRVWEECLKVNPKQPALRDDVAKLKQQLRDRPAAPEGPGTTGPAPRDGGILEVALPPLGGWALASDGLTLAVSIPSEGALAWFDTESGRETRRVRTDFRPGSLVFQDKTLFVSAVGSSLVYGLEASSGKVLKEIKVPGEPIVFLAAHASKGPLFASNAREEVVVIEPSGGSVKKTTARGRFLAVDPKSGAFLYTGRTSPNEFDVEVEKNADGSSTWYFDNWGYRSMIRKYAIGSAGLKQVAVNDNTAVNGRAMHLSPDGARIAMAGGGGWRGKRGGGGGYTIAVYDAADATTMLGQVDLGAYPENIAFHPVLNVGAALKSEGELHLFNAKSLVTFSKQSISGAPRGFNEPGWLTFGGRGTRLVYWQMGASYEGKPGKLYFIPLELTRADRDLLQKAYGAGAPPGAAAGSSGAALLRQAEEAESAGDLARAAELYRAAAAADPSSEAGKRASRKALELSEAKPEAGPAVQLLNTARQMEKNGAPALAVKYYRRIVAEHPQSAEAAEARKRLAELGER